MTITTRVEPVRAPDPPPRRPRGRGARESAEAGAGSFREVDRADEDGMTVIYLLREEAVVRSGFASIRRIRSAATSLDLPRRERPRLAETGDET
jgi:hypothetical protein